MDRPNRWHTVTIEEALQQLNSSVEGLASTQVTGIRNALGSNRLPPPHTRSRWQVFIDQFKNALVYFLLIAAGISLAFQEWQDGIVILFVITLNAMIGYRQEYQSTAAVRRLLRMTPHLTHVVRDGLEREISADELVIGDIVQISAGDTVPADGRWIEVAHVRVVEAALTGEAAPVEKQTEVEPLTVAASDRHNMAWRGTNVATGRGQFVVTAVGRDTRFGKIITESRFGATEPTPLEQKLAAFSRRLGYGTIIIGLLIFGLGAYRHLGFEEILLLAVSMIVSIIPEGLPVVITMAMAWGMWEMAKRQALIQKLSAIETLGSVTIVATDKTGTLTFGEMMVEKLWVDHQSFHFTGQGYAPVGDILLNEQPILGREQEGLSWALRLGAMNNDSRFTWSETNTRQAIGDPTELALIVAAGKAGWSKHDLDMVHPRLGEIPFEFQKKYMVTWHRHSAQERVVIIKGAPKEVLAQAKHRWTAHGTESLTDAERARLMEVYERWASEGLRGLAIAYAIVPASDSFDVLKVFGHFTVVGMFGMADQVRPEAASAISTMRTAGIRVLMLTGDYQKTGVSIAKRIGLLDRDKPEYLLDGGEIDDLSDVELRHRLSQARVGTRLTPEHKFRIAQLLRQSHEIVAMTGDGINDVPAITEADVGIAVGSTATDAAKEASDVVLLDGNFSSLTTAIAEGRRIHRNIRRVMFYLLASNFGELLLVLAALMIGLPLPLLPKHIIWLNAVTDPFLGIALAREPHSPNAMHERPHDPRAPIVSRSMFERMLITALGLALGALFVFGISFQSGRSTEMIYAMTLTSLALGQWLTALNARSSLRSIFTLMQRNRSLQAAFVIVIIMQLIILYVPPLANIFSVAPLSLVDWMIVIVGALPVVVVDEVRKVWYRQRYRPHLASS